MIILQYGKTYVDEPTVGFYCKHKHEHLEKILVQLQQQQVREEETKGEKQKVKFEDTNGFKLVGVQGTTEIYTFLHAESEAQQANKVEAMYQKWQLEQLQEQQQKQKGKIFK